jgi:hypothetical protein
MRWILTSISSPSLNMVPVADQPPWLEAPVASRQGVDTEEPRSTVLGEVYKQAPLHHSGDLTRRGDRTLAQQEGQDSLPSNPRLGAVSSGRASVDVSRELVEMRVLQRSLQPGFRLQTELLSTAFKKCVQGSVDREVGIAADGRCEVQIGVEVEAEVADLSRGCSAPAAGNEKPPPTRPVRSPFAAPC